MNNIFNNLFGQRSYNPLMVSDWLLNMRDAFLAEGHEAADSDPNSPKILSFFTLAMCSQSTNNLLHFDDKIINKIDNVFLECRGYYDCLWQMHLLMIADSDEDIEKVRNLAALVDLCITSTLKSVFSSNKNINTLLGKSIVSDYSRLLAEIVPLYIHSAFESKNWVSHVVGKFSMRMTEYIRNVEQWPKVLAALGDDTLNSLSLKILTGFDLKQCNIKKLPKELLTK